MGAPRAGRTPCPDTVTTKRMEASPSCASTTGLPSSSRPSRPRSTARSDEARGAAHRPTGLASPPDRPRRDALVRVPTRRDVVLQGGRLALQIARHPAPVVVRVDRAAARDGRRAADGARPAHRRAGRLQDRLQRGRDQHGHALVPARYLARERLSERHFQRATVQAEIYGPDDALAVGFLDRVVDADDLHGIALDEAARLAEAGPRARSAAQTSRCDGIGSTSRKGAAGASVPPGVFSGCSVAAGF